jgi:leucyl aminopeptidase
MEVIDHNYYKAELQKLEESTRRIHKEVDRILAEFRRNMEEYRLHTGEAVTTTKEGTKHIIMDTLKYPEEEQNKVNFNNYLEYYKKKKKREEEEYEREKEITYTIAHNAAAAAAKAQQEWSHMVHQFLDIPFDQRDDDTDYMIRGVYDFLYKNPKFWGI